MPWTISRETLSTSLGSTEGLYIDWLIDDDDDDDDDDNNNNDIVETQKLFL